MNHSKVIFSVSLVSMLQFFKALGQIVRVLVQTHDDKDDMFIQSLIRLDSQHHNYETRDCQDLLLMEEILHQSIGSLSHDLQGLIHPRWCRISSINSIPNWMSLSDGQHLMAQLGGSFGEDEVG